MLCKSFVLKLNYVVQIGSIPMSEAEGQIFELSMAETIQKGEEFM